MPAGRTIATCRTLAASLSAAWLVVATAACGGSPISSLEELRDAAAMRIAVVGGEAAKVYERGIETENLQFQVRDATGAPVPGVAVTFSLMEVPPSVTPEAIEDAWLKGRFSMVRETPLDLNVEGEMVTWEMPKFLGEILTADEATDSDGIVRVKIKSAMRYGARVAVLAHVKGEEIEGGGSGYAVALTPQAPPAPATFAVLAPRFATNDGTPAVAWEAAERASHYRIVAAKDQGCAEVIHRFDEVKSTSLDLPEMTDGPYHVCITAWNTDSPLITRASNNGYAFKVDTVAPKIQSIAFDKPDGLYRAGVRIPVKIRWDEPVLANGSDTDLKLALAVEPSGAAAVYESGSGTNEWTFVYTVADGDLAGDLDVAAVAPQITYSDTTFISDDALNAAAAQFPSGSLAGTSAIGVDAVPPGPFTLAAFATPTADTTPTFTWVAAERERCAKVCDSVNNYDNPMTARDCADAIRKDAP